MTGKIGTKYARVSGGKSAALPRGPKRELPAEFYAKGHRHGCRRCDLLIIMCSCPTPHEDPFCDLCQYGRNPAWPDIVSDGLPRDCCRAHAEKLNKEAKKSFLLAGTREWYGCPVCHRKHPFDPSSESNDPPTSVEGWTERFGELPTPDYRKLRW